MKSRAALHLHFNVDVYKTFYIVRFVLRLKQLLFALFFFDYTPYFLRYTLEI